MFLLSFANNSQKNPAIRFVESLSSYKSRTRICPDIRFVQEDK